MLTKIKYQGLPEIQNIFCTQTAENSMIKPYKPIELKVVNKFIENRQYEKVEAILEELLHQIKNGLIPQEPQHI